MFIVCIRKMDFQKILFIQIPANKSRQRYHSCNAIEKFEEFLSNFDKDLVFH